MSDLRYGAWREHVLDAEEGGADPATREPSAWLRSATLRYLESAAADGRACGHAGEAVFEATFFDPRFDATLCAPCAIDFIVTMPPNECARCGDATQPVRARVAILGERMFAMVPLCRECTLLEGLAPIG